MHSQFVEEVRYKNSGIWVRVRQADSCDNAVIRKSKSVYTDAVGSTAGYADSTVKRSVPKAVLDKYNKLFNKQCRQRKQSTSSNMFQLAAIEQALSSYNRQRNATDDSVADDRICDIEVVGVSKLKSEALAAKRISGPKFYVKNHYYNELGEGEPIADEEVLA